MTNRKTTFFWASIAGADPEPVELVIIDGRKAVYTCGCADPFFLNDPNSPVRLGTQSPASAVGHHNHLWLWVADKTPKPIPRPVLASKKEADQIAARYLEPPPPHHSWRGPR